MKTSSKFLEEMISVEGVRTLLLESQLNLELPLLKLSLVRNWEYQEAKVEDTYN